MKQVSCSENNNVWGVNKHYHIYRWTKGKWTRIGGSLIMVNVGFAGVWGVNKGNSIYYRVGTYGDKRTSGAKVSNL